MSHLAGKVALVTGGSRGIGAGIAKALAKHGASVAITFTKGTEAAAKVVKEIEGAGGKALAIPFEHDRSTTALLKKVRTQG